MEPRAGFPFHTALCDLLNFDLPFSLSVSFTACILHVVSYRHSHTYTRTYIDRRKAISDTRSMTHKYAVEVIRVDPPSTLESPSVTLQLCFQQRREVLNVNYPQLVRVRSAPPEDLLTLRLVDTTLHMEGSAAQVPHALAATVEPLAIGGPFRPVGSCSLPLHRVGGGGELLSPVCHVWVAWEVAKEGWSVFYTAPLTMIDAMPPTLQEEEREEELRMCAHLTAKGQDGEEQERAAAYTDVGEVEGAKRSEAGVTPTSSTVREADGEAVGGSERRNALPSCAEMPNANGPDPSPATLPFMTPEEEAAIRRRWRYFSSSTVTVPPIPPSSSPSSILPDTGVRVYDIPPPSAMREFIAHRGFASNGASAHSEELLMPALEYYRRKASEEGGGTRYTSRLPMRRSVAYAELKERIAVLCRPR